MVSRGRGSHETEHQAAHRSSDRQGRVVHVSTDGAPAGDPQLEVVRASLSDKAVLRRLVQLYYYDFSEWTGNDIDEHEEFGHRYLDHYWTDRDSHPFLIRQAGRWAGFALVRTDGVNDMSEFFVMQKYRRSGVGRDAARLVFALFPGAWQVRQLHGNDAATAFWRAVVPSGHAETVTEEGPVQLFTI